MPNPLALDPRDERAGAAAAHAALSAGQLAPRLGYLQAGRTWTYSALLALPVMVLYEVTVEVVNRVEGLPVRNGADVLLQSLLPISGDWGGLALPLLALLVLGGGAFLERRTGQTGLAEKAARPTS